LFHVGGGWCKGKLKDMEELIIEKIETNNYHTQQEIVDISIIVPLYNKEVSVGKCLETILCCRSYLLEIIVVDDGSIDNSVSVVKKYQYEDKRIKLICHEKNRGTFAARETGIRAAKGKYIFCVDPDDSINSECFKKAEPYFDKMDIIAFNMEFVHADCNEFWGEPFDQSLTGKDILDAYVNCRIQNWGVCSKLIKREITIQSLDALNVDCRLTISEDLFLNFAVCFFAQTYFHVNFTAYYYSYFHNAVSATRKIFTFESFSDAMEQNRYILQKLTDLFNNNGYDEHFLFMTKKNLAAFFLEKIRAIPDLNEKHSKIMLIELAYTMGSFAVYSVAMGSERDFILSILQENINDPLSRIQNLESTLI
jgi:glycosyltransferase involved in cell wall biosynthesis